MIKPKNNVYELTDNFTYKDVVVPRGFTTDGVTAKIRFLYMFIHRFDPRVIEAVIIHDYLCEIEEYTKADKYFEELLPDIWQKVYMVRAVKIYHSLRGLK